MGLVNTAAYSTRSLQEASNRQGNNRTVRPWRRNFSKAAAQYYWTAQPASKLGERIVIAWKWLATSCVQPEAGLIYYTLCTRDFYIRGFEL